jgi:hypothetical protein
MFTITLEHLRAVAAQSDPVDFESLGGDAMRLWAARAHAAGLIRPAHGDAGFWLRRGLRNERLLFWHRDAGFLLPTAADIDTDYAGGVPPAFRVGDEFAPDHWASHVDSAAVFISDELAADLRAQLAARPAERRTQPAVRSDNIVLHIRGRAHKVVGITPAQAAEPAVWFDACTGLCPCGELRR